MTWFMIPYEKKTVEFHFGPLKYTPVGFVSLFD